MQSFSSLAVGTTFEFDRTGLPLGHGMAIGPWRKTGTRSYVHINRPDLVHKVGTVQVKVWTVKVTV